MGQPASLPLTIDLPDIFHSHEMGLMEVEDDHGIQRRLRQADQGTKAVGRIQLARAFQIAVGTGFFANGPQSRIFFSIPLKTPIIM